MLRFAKKTSHIKKYGVRSSSFLVQKLVKKLQKSYKTPRQVPAGWKCKVVDAHKTISLALSHYTLRHAWEASSLLLFTFLHLQDSENQLFFAIIQKLFFFRCILGAKKKDMVFKALSSISLFPEIVFSWIDIELGKTASFNEISMPHWPFQVMHGLLRFSENQ